MDTNMIGRQVKYGNRVGIVVAIRAAKLLDVDSGKVHDAARFKIKPPRGRPFWTAAMAAAN